MLQIFILIAMTSQVIAIFNFQVFKYNGGKLEAFNCFAYYNSAEKYTTVNDLYYFKNWELTRLNRK